MHNKPEAKVFTYKTRLSLDVAQNAFLGDQAALLSSIKRKLFADYNKGLNILNQKSKYLREFGITARQFNAIRIEVQMLSRSQLALLQDYATDQKSAISKNEKLIKNLEKKLMLSKNQANRLHQTRRKLVRQECKLSTLEQDIKDQRVHICFGGKKLFNKQFNLEENGYNSHEQWKEDWHAARNNQFFLVGSKDETMGNQSCIVTINDDLTLNFRIRAANCLQSKYGKFITIKNIALAHGQAEVLQALKSNLKRNQLQKTAARKINGDLYKEHGQAISYRFIKDAKGWQVHMTVEMQAPAKQTIDEIGVIGMDLNANHLAITETDRTGNPVNSFNIPVNTYGKSSTQATAIIGDAIKQLVDYAVNKQKSIVVENLDFQTKKRNLKQISPRQARLLSSFSYSKIISMLDSRAFRFGVDLYHVNPAYSSIIGRVKFARQYKLSIHKAAALVIARRQQRYSERLPRRLDNIPDDNGFRFTLPQLEKIVAGHVWKSWAKVLKSVQAVLVVRYQMFRQPGLSRACSDRGGGIADFF